ncbi:hypothetical protein M8818_006928, partial [Zalaria obscura]
LAIAIVSIAITTCLAANFLLAHSATVARNKLAEIVQTRRKLWAAIAQKENAEAAALARSEFIASASHEIRTPLHQLQGYSDLLSRTNLSDESRLLLYAIQDATRTLSLITSNVLDWSRLEKGEAVCRPTALDMRRVCESIIHSLPTMDEDSDVELMIAVAPEVSDSLFLDETYVHRIIMNLLSNSLKFTQQGCVLLHITVEDSNLIATVRDTGCGIPDVFLPQLFEPFKQAQTRGAHRGTGLGLSIVKQLLQKMHGTIGVESKHKATKGVHPDETGTVFTVAIPAQSAKTGESATSKHIDKLAVFNDHKYRTMEGIRLAWETFGTEVIEVEDISELSTSYKHVWIDAPYLMDNPELLRKLSAQDQWVVIIPYENEKALHELRKIAKSGQFLPIRKPIMFHKLLDSISTFKEQPAKIEASNRKVSFAPEATILDGDVSRTGSPKPDGVQTKTGPLKKSKGTVLLVEDNKINQRLGAKMLQALSYSVILASDGQEAIELIAEHDAVVDVILMDQSMPRKDGVTATREIREMEEKGLLKWNSPNGGGVIRRPIIAVTAVVGEHAEQLCRAAGTDAFLTKPLGLDKLREALEIWAPERESKVLVGE